MSERDLDAMKSAVQKLSALMADPQPGLWSWCYAVRRAYDELGRIMKIG